MIPQSISKVAVTCEVILKMYLDIYNINSSFLNFFFFFLVQQLQEDTKNSQYLELIFLLKILNTMHQTWLKWVSSFQDHHKIDRQMWNPRHLLNWNREVTFENSVITPSPPITMANIYQVFSRCDVKKCIWTWSNIILKGALGGRCFYRHFKDDRFRKRLGSWPKVSQLLCGRAGIWTQGANS